MRFVETPAFTTALRSLLDEGSYRELQVALLLRPEAGSVIRGAGGLRKLRWGASGRGKRGGTRIIYYWQADDETFWMLFVYAKNDQEDLTPRQVQQLRRLVEEELK